MDDKVTMGQNQSHLSHKLSDEREDVMRMTREALQLMEDRFPYLRDAALESYLNGIAQRIVNVIEFKIPHHIQVKVVRDPTINASAMLTGNISFHSGILSRLENEHQVAFVMAHEISHVYHQDILYYMNNLKKKTVAFKIADLILTPAAMVVGAGGLASSSVALLYGSSVSGYGRDHERQADLFALEKMLEAGYDPREGLRVEEIFLSEKDKYQKGMEIFFLSSHPSTKERIQSIKKWLRANEVRVLSKVPSFTQGASYDMRMKDLYLNNAKLNLDFNRYFHAQDDLEKVFDMNINHAEALYLKGESYRKMSEWPKKVEEELSKDFYKKVKGKKSKDELKEYWLEEARVYYSNAISSNAGFALAYKGMGLYAKEKGLKEEAEKNFDKYLELNPGAKDYRSIQRHLRDLARMA